jgi:hypothetical protein
MTDFSSLKKKSLKPGAELSAPTSAKKWERAGKERFKPRVGAESSR